ncbi:MAG: TolC family protein [Proteobacteria bacterium]|nr:TolC family protein [Pseudomonadota bacterium]
MRNIAKILLASMVMVCAANATAADLLELYDQALATNPPLKGKEYMVDQAKAQKDQAMSKLLPQISAIGNLSWSNLAQVVPATAAARQTVDTVSYEGTRGLVQARQALFDLPSYLRLQGAGLTIQQTELELQATHMAVAADLVERYFLVLEATDEMSAIEGEKALTEGDIKRIRRMHELQLAPVTDQLEIEAYYQTLLTHEIEIENARLVGLEKLRELAGVPVAAIAPLVKEVLPDVPGKIDEWVVESTRREMEAREKARDAQQRSYELGVATIVALLESKKNLLKARFEHARARYVYIRSLTALRLWAGSLSRESLEGINAWLAKAG